ncbi:MAG: AAA family ATPase [Lachnospiraceae bacterium]|nr:AAA family ATPase [Lachnospiraceae bacterium]
MGIYVNPGYDGFEEIRRDIYVDKTGLIAYMNSLIGKPKPLVSFSRPRRFGKSFDANMLCAYYDKSCDSRFLFEDLAIAKEGSFEKHLNQYHVISFDVTGFITDAKEKRTNVISEIKNSILKELREAFPGCIEAEETAIKQIHDNRYDGVLKDYIGNLLLVGINYDKEAKGEGAKKHSCVIESV